MAPRSTNTLAIAVLVVGALAGAGLAVAVVDPGAPAADADGPAAAVDGIEQFGTRSAFEAYVARGRLAGSTAWVDRRRAQRAAVVEGAAGGDGGERDVEREAARTPQPAMTETEGGGAPERIGETNVQVAALDEPDRVKADAARFYYAPRSRTVRPVERRTDVVRTETEADGHVGRPRRPGRTHVVDASEPADPRAIAAIDDSGQLLRTGDVLVVLANDHLAGYDVGDPSNPTEVWRRPLDDELVTARERNGTVYLVTRTPVGVDDPCPIAPVGEDAAVPCGDVYRPDAQVAVDATYSAFAIDAADGDVADSVSFVGTGDGTVVYASNEALYVTYVERTGRADLTAEFLLEEFDRTPERVRERIEEIRSYDISPRSERREIELVVERWLGSLSEDRRDDLRRDLRNGLEDYVATRQRDLTRTGIVRVGIDDASLAVEATGSVPGRPLNQFSMDEHEGTLRIATTIPGVPGATSANDLYALDAASLSIRGSERGMGDGQRVYAVRYVGDTAYVVTFRRVDPLHVLDLSDPTDPVETGTLQLPGFSSYLHPIDDDHVLGIGEEAGRVKAVLFDVSDPTDPAVADDLRLRAGWSAVAETHHAFTIDRRHGVFFLPAGGQGMVVDYTNGSLSVTHDVETAAPAERARYVDDYLYVFAGREVAVVDETVWERVATLTLE